MTLSPGTQTYHLRGTILPSGQLSDVWVTGGKLSFEPVAGAQTLPHEGFVLPGLVDAHIHPGLTGIGEPLSEDKLRADLHALARLGITLIRVPGSPSRLPSWAFTEPGLPRILAAGVPIAAVGRFFEGWGRECEQSAVPEAAADEASSGGWAKLITDWFDESGEYSPSLSQATLTEAVRRVHASGGRVAAHSQHATSGRDAVLAGADSIEHGMHLPLDVLDLMASQGTALVPTAVTFATAASAMTGADVPPPLRHWFEEGWERHPQLVRRAHEAGVLVLAGTDLPVGALLNEIRWLNQAGLPMQDALGAASWTARAWLGLPGIEHGAPADLLLVREDPRLNLDTLTEPLAVLIGGYPVVWSS